MSAAYERSTSGVENYTLVFRSMGASSVSYYERETVGGLSLFRLRASASSSGTYAFSLDGDVVGYGDVLLFGPILAQRGTAEGRTQIEGRPVHVLAVADLHELRLTGPAGPDDVDFAPHRARIYVDSELWIPIGFDFTGRSTLVADAREVRIELRLSDIRSHEGLLIPHRTRIEIDGLESVIDERARARLSELRDQLERMPAVQRQLMEEMMSEEMEGLRRMLGADGGPTEIEIDITSVAVNQGPPGR